MKDSEGNVKLIKHVNQRVEEFLDECNPQDFGNMVEMEQAFARFLRLKDVGTNRLKETDGVIALHVQVEDAVDEKSATVAFVKMLADGRVGVMWSPILFSKHLPMPDELREMLVERLRFHADRLEDRSLDVQMRNVLGKQAGTA